MLFSIEAIPIYILNSAYSKFFARQFTDLHLFRVHIWNLLVLYDCVIFTRFFVILDSLHWYLCIQVISLLFQTSQFHFGRDSPSSSAQLGVLSRSAGSVCG